MKERTDRIAALLEKWLRKELTSQEQSELDAWLLEGDDNRMIFQQLTDQDQLLERLRIYDQVNSESMWKKTMDKINPDAKVVVFPKKKIVWYKYAAAAAVLLAVSAGVYFMMDKPGESGQANNQHEVAPAETDVIVPGGNYANLTLADGSLIKLNETPDGNFKEQGSMSLSKTNGQLIYSGRFITSGPVSTGSEKHASLHNMVSTPRGGQYQITLPDGSKVWLNAASSLRFPLAFAGNQREVELTGEAYFEVKQMSLPGSSEKMPFIVKVTNAKYNEAEVEVLGTHFNVMAYDDESSIKTTLLEGSVRVKNAVDSKIIKPNEQAVAQNGELTVKKVTGENEISWKNGAINTDGGIENIMNQVARWYDVKIVYEGGKVSERMKKVEYVADIPRGSSFDDLLKILESQNIHLKKEGRKLIVMQ